MTIRRNSPVPSVYRPVRLPEKFSHLLRPTRATPGLTDSPAQSQIAPNATGALFPGPRRTRKTPRLPTETFAATPSCSLTGNTLFLVLPIPPSINRQYATVNGRRVLAAAGRHYKRMVGQLCMANTASSSSAWHRFLHEAPERALTLTIHCYFPTLLRRDLDGGIKITQDAICEAMNLNDNRIMEIHLYKTLDHDKPRLECALTLTTSLRRPARRTPPAGRRTGRHNPR